MDKKEESRVREEKGVGVKPGNVSDENGIRVVCEEGEGDVAIGSGGREIAKGGNGFGVARIENGIKRERDEARQSMAWKLSMMMLMHNTNMLLQMSQENLLLIL